ncbi:hypothetical protein HPP92_015020 [Vanilla planifolia]|uniref:Uncharacterized protein n=1 Tax=Vanilla planifolia TaxID=51239 RepID=A0A835QSN2_VANPL|nr:hypothetical protein HPP92_015020 [Vanilla planifolia]
MNERVQYEDVGIKGTLDDLPMESEAFSQHLKLGSSFECEWVGEVVREVGAVGQQAGEELQAEVRPRISNVGANEDVPHVEAWLGNLVEHLESIVEVGGWGKRAGGDEATGGVGLEEEAKTEHSCVNLLEPNGVESRNVIEKRKDWVVGWKQMAAISG